MEELAKILGTTKGKLKPLAEAMGEFTGKKDVMEKVINELARERGEALSQLGLDKGVTYKEVIEALVAKVRKTEGELLEYLQHPDCSTHEGCQVPIKTAFDLAKTPQGFFLKEDKARELFLAKPPRKIMSEFGYENVEKMLAVEDIYQIFASLRFLEDKRWLNEEFFSSYSSLTVEDFEKRNIKIQVLPKDRFGSIGAEFMRKKFHNVSHLKEMGLIFVLPVEQEAGVLLRMFALLLHYLHEVTFYAKHFELCAKEPANFIKNVTASLRGDVREEAPPIENLFSWLVVQRYLAKDDPNDPRLAMPHVSSEALFWSQAAVDLAKLGKEDPGLGLSFWGGKAHIAGVFDDKVVSFNFEDNIFSAVPGRDVEQYTYHMREALWNRVFTGYFDEKVLDELMVEGFTQGFVGFRLHTT